MSLLSDVSRVAQWRANAWRRQRRAHRCLCGRAVHLIVITQSYKSGVAVRRLVWRPEHVAQVMMLLPLRGCSNFKNVVQALTGWRERKEVVVMRMLA